MALSSDLLSQFAKITNDKSEQKNETIVYGTITISDGKTYVQIDGSTISTPITTTTDVKHGDRVTVMIKDHVAVVTGNLTARSATKDNVDQVEKDLGNRLDEFDTIVAGKVSTDQLVAVRADINDLKAKDVEVRGKLEAAEADIDKLVAKDVTIEGKLEGHDAEFESIDAKFVNVDGKIVAAEGKIGKLEATEADFRTLESDYGTFKNLTAENFEAANADIENLKAKDVTIDGKLTANEAAINDLSANKLDANSAVIKDLTADVANIDTLIFGTASGNVIQTSFANAVIAQLGNAQIKSAMIENISASKITAGDVITNNVRVMSEDGKLLISDETIQISDATRVRVQIGKDATGDYSISVWDADGKLMFSEGGITDNAIKNAIIRDDMVSDTANISAHKIDINSLFEEINGSTKTIKSSKIYLDDKSQTLDVAFTSLSSDVDDLSDDVSSQGTQITAIQGQITSKVWQQDIDTSVDGLDKKLSTKYSELEQTVDGISLEVSNVQVGARNLLRYSRRRVLNSNNSALYPISYTVETENGREFNRYVRTQTDLAPTTMSLYSAIPVTEITEVLTGQEITFSFLIRCSHVATTNTMNTIVINGTSHNFGTTETHTIDSKWKRISLTATIAHEYEVVGSNILRFNPLMIVIPDGAIDTFYVDVCEWKIEKGNKATDWTPAPEDTDEKFGNYSTTAEMNAAINLKADGIVSTVSSTYTTKEDFNNLNVGGRNIVRDSSLNAKTDMWTFDTANAYSFENGYCEVYRNDVNGSRTFNSQSTNKNSLLKPDDLPGGTFTLSAEIKVLDGYTIANGSTLFYRCNTSELSSGFQEIAIQLGEATTEWTKVSSTYTFGDYNFDGSCQVCIALADAAGIGICIRNIKLERGNKATDWTAAPEDMSSNVDSLQETVSGYAGYEERIIAAETSITQLKDQISMLVQDGNKSSKMEFDADSATYSFNTGEIDDKISSNTDDIEALQNGAATTNDNVESLQNKLNSWEEHISITTYEDEPALILFEDDSNHKQYVTNTRRIITETVDGIETVKSEVNLDTATYDNVVVKEKSQIGGFAWKKRGSNRICLVWEGEIE